MEDFGAWNASIKSSGHLPLPNLMGDDFCWVRSRSVSDLRSDTTLLDSLLDLLFELEEPSSVSSATLAKSSGMVSLGRRSQGVAWWVCRHSVVALTLQPGIRP